MESKEIKKALRTLGLPEMLINWLRNGQLLTEIQAARKHYLQCLALMEQWEINNQEAYERLPYYQARERWKADGRPEPHWIELLVLWKSKALIMPGSAITRDVLPIADERKRALKAADPEYCEKERAKRRAISLRHIAKKKMQELG